MTRASFIPRLFCADSGQLHLTLVVPVSKFSFILCEASRQSSWVISTFRVEKCFIRSVVDVLKVKKFSFHILLRGKFKWKTRENRNKEKFLRKRILHSPISVKRRNLKLCVYVYLIDFPPFTAGMLLKPNVNYLFSFCSSSNWKTSTPTPTEDREEKLFYKTELGLCK